MTLRKFWLLNLQRIYKEPGMRMQTTDSSHLLEKLRQEDHSVESLQRLGSIPSISQEGESEEVCKESWRDGSVVRVLLLLQRTQVQFPT